MIPLVRRMQKSTAEDGCRRRAASVRPLPVRPQSSSSLRARRDCCDTECKSRPMTSPSSSACWPSSSSRRAEEVDLPAAEYSRNVRDELLACVSMISICTTGIYGALADEVLLWPLCWTALWGLLSPWHDRFRRRWARAVLILRVCHSSHIHRPDVLDLPAAAALAVYWP